MSSINARFFKASGASGDGDGHSLSANIPNSGGTGDGAASAGDILFVNTVSQVDTTVVVTDNISGATGWQQIGDSLEASHLASHNVTTGFVTTKWWKLCVGGETSVTCDWSPSGNGRAFSALIGRSMGALQEVYLIGEDNSGTHFGDKEMGRYDGSGIHDYFEASSDGEMYIGATAIGNSNYTNAQFQGISSHDNNGVQGDGANTGGGAVGFGCLMHINDDTGNNHTTDTLRYLTDPNVETFHSLLGIRVPNSGETYAAFLIEPPTGKTYSGVTGGGGATWTGKDQDDNSGAHGMSFYDTTGLHSLNDLPVLDVNFTSAPSANGYAILCALGDTQGGFNRSQGNSGNGDDPTASITYFGPSAGDSLLYLLVVDNGGTAGATPGTYTLLDSGVIGSGGSAQHWYLYSKLHSDGDQDRFNFSIPLTGTNIHWVIRGLCFNDLGDAPAYVLGKGAAVITNTTHLVFTAASHGLAPENTVLPVVSKLKPKVGKPISVSTGTWLHADTYTYQWGRCTAGTPSDIGGATSSTYLVQEADLGLGLFCKVTAHNDHGTGLAQTATTQPVKKVSSQPWMLARNNDYLDD